MPTVRTNRRKFLRGAVAVAAGGTVAWALKELYPPDTPLGDSERAHQIGARYASQYPADEVDLWRGDPPATASEWGPRIEQLRREDFEADRLVRVEGWWLAETELRLCVLLHSMS